MSQEGFMPTNGGQKEVIVVSNGQYWVRDYLVLKTKKLPATLSFFIKFLPNKNFDTNKKYRKKEDRSKF
jgi:hypothetical protein